MCEWETRKAAVRGLFFCEHGIVIDTCEELDHLGEQAMQYLNITLREKDTQVIPFCADGTYWVPVEAGEAKDVRAEKWMEYYQCDQERFWKFQRYFYEWTGEIPKRLELSVKPEKTRYEGTSFAVKAGAVDQKVEVMHPVTKEHYELNIKESVPEHVLKITYEIAPQPKDDFYLQDCEEGDTVWTTAYGKRSVSVIGGQSGPTSIFLAGTIEPSDQVAYSSPHFHPVKETTWKPVFYRQELEEEENFLIPYYKILEPSSFQWLIFLRWCLTGLSYQVRRKHSHSGFWLNRTAVCFKRRSLFPAVW